MALLKRKQNMLKNEHICLLVNHANIVAIINLLKSFWDIWHIAQIKCSFCLFLCVQPKVFYMFIYDCYSLSITTVDSL